MHVNFYEAKWFLNLELRKCAAIWEKVYNGGKNGAWDTAGSDGRHLNEHFPPKKNQSKRAKIGCNKALWSLEYLQKTL